MGEPPFYLEAKHCSGGKVSLYLYLEMDTEGRVGSAAAPSLWPAVAQEPSVEPPCPHPSSMPLWLPLSGYAECRLSACGLACPSTPIAWSSWKSLSVSVPSLLCLKQGTTCNLQVRGDSVVGEGAGARPVQVTVHSGATDPSCPPSLSSLTRFSVV